MLTRRRLRRLRPPLTAAVPVAVWLLAIAGALHLHGRLGSSGSVAGFAEDQPVSLAHPESAVVRDVHVQLYDHVRAGQTLLSLDDRQERIQLAAIETDVKRLQAEIAAEQAMLAADNARATSDVDDLVRRFAVDREAAHIDYLSKLAADARDRILLHGATAEYEIVRSLHEQGTAPFRELNDIQTEVDSLRAAITEKARVLERSKQALEAADQRWARFVEHEEVSAFYEPVLTPLRLAVDVKRRDLEEIVRRIDSHVLRAPIDGQVTELAVHAGDSVQPGVRLLAISPTSTSRVLAYLPEPMTLSTRAGEPVTVRCLASAAGGRREYAGTVTGLSDTVTEAPLRYRQMPSYPVWGRGLMVTLSQDVRLVPGEAVTIAFLEHR